MNSSPDLAALSWHRCTCRLLRAAFVRCAMPTASRRRAKPPLVDRAIEDRILAMDPEKVSQADVRNVLAKGPTPRIMLMHGGIYPVHLAMESFGKFLAEMGYPEAKMRDPYRRQRGRTARTRTPSASPASSPGTTSRTACRR